MLRPEGTCRVSSQLCLSRGVVTLPQDGLNEGAARRIEMTATAGCTKAATRIVECIPQGVQTSLGVGWASVPKSSPRPCGDQGRSLPPPGPPASHLLCSAGKFGGKNVEI